MSDQQPLSTAERDKLARDLLEVQLGMTKPVQEPEAILTAGQPGSGKSMVVRSVSIQYEDRGGAVTIDPDAIRPNIPYMRDRIAQGDLTIPDAAYQDAGTIAAAMMKLSAEANRNIIYDGTLANTFYARKNSEYLRESGYRVEIHGMAVDPDLSHARTYSRREAEIITSPTGFGRGVGDKFHDDAVAGLVSTIKALQDEGKVDAIVLYDRTGKRVGSVQLEEGRWVPDKSMADELKKVHATPDQQSRDEAAKTWDGAANLMMLRDADPVDRLKVEAFRDAARALTAAPDVRDADKLAAPRPVEPLAGQLSRISPVKARDEIDKYLPVAREEAAALLRGAAKGNGSSVDLDAARHDLNYVTHPKGAAYQARVIEQLGVRSVEAVIGRHQTPLERVRQLGSAIDAEIKRHSPAQVEKAMLSVDRNTGAPAQQPTSLTKQTAPQQTKDRGLER